MGDDRSGQLSHEVVGASPFPRHWIYDDTGTLVEKSATIDFGKWFNHSFGERTPWAEQDSPAVVAAMESVWTRRPNSRAGHARIDSPRLSCGDRVRKE